MSMIRDGAGNVIDSTNPLQVNATTTDILPVDIQSRYATTIQTHNAVSVAASSSSSGAWIDCDGFDEVSITLMNDAATSNQVNILWSHDGATSHGEEVLLSAVARQRGKATVKIGARYLKVWISNTDAAAHTMSAWAYLKA